MKQLKNANNIINRYLMVCFHDIATNFYLRSKIYTFFWIYKKLPQGGLVYPSENYIK